MTDKENYLTHEKIVIIDQLYSFGFTKADISAKFRILNHRRITKSIFRNGIKQGTGFMAELPDELKNCKRDAKGLLSLIKQNQEPCENFCSKKCKLCCPNVCQIRTTKEFFFERLIYLLKKSDETRRAAQRRYYNNSKQRQKEQKIMGRPCQKQVVLKSDGLKVDKSIKYQDYPPEIVNYYDAKTEQHNRQVGFNPKTASRNAQTHDYSRLYDSF